jgi:hypothetical protein
MTSAPAICKRGDYLHIFARGLDNQLWHSYKSTKPAATPIKIPGKGSVWIPWQKEKENIPDLPVGLKSAPSAVAPSASRIDIVVQGKDDQVYHLFYEGGWSKTWEPLGGIVTARPTCCWSDNRFFHVFARGTDSQIYHKYFDTESKHWHNPDNPGDHQGWGKDVPAHPKGGIYSAPVAVVDSPGRIDLFAGTGGAEIWNMRWTGGWQNWKPISVKGVSYPAG